MANLAAQSAFGLTGIAPTYNACASGGDSFANANANVMLDFRNTGTEKTVTFNSLVNCDYGFDHNPTLVVPATTGARVIGPFSKARFNDANDRVGMTYSPDTTGLTVAVLALQS